MNNIDYDNLIELLKQALLFYADKENYGGATGTIAPIDSDDYGSQARFALSKIDEMKTLSETMEDEYKKQLEELSKNENNGADFLKIVENYQKMNGIKGNDKAI